MKSSVSGGIKCEHCGIELMNAAITNSKISQLDGFIVHKTQLLGLMQDLTNKEQAFVQLKKEFDKHFKISLVDYEYEEMVIPNTDYDAEFSLPSKKVSDMLSQLNNFGDDLNIKCAEDCVNFKTNRDSVEMRVNIPVDDMSSYAIIEDGEVNLTYSLIYINKMCITNKLSNDIEFSLSNECPMKINFDLGDNSSLMFFIAPKLSDD